MEKMRLLNTYVNNVTLDEAVEFLLQKIREQTPAYVVEVNGTGTTVFICAYN